VSDPESIVAYILDGECVRITSDPEDVRRAHAENKNLWLHLLANTPVSSGLLEGTFAIHPLVIEDIWADRALPKLEAFEEYLYILVHGVRRDSDATKLALLELDVVLGRNFVITHHQGLSRSVEAVVSELARSPRILRKGAPWVVHALLDHLVDHYLPLIDDLDDEVNDLEDRVLDTAGSDQHAAFMTRIFDLKRTLSSLRRVAVHQREILLRLSRNEFDQVPAESAPFFRDVYDHFARVTDLAESYRELVSGAFEAYLSVQSNRMNEIMKTLTLISTIMLPLTFVAGVYGMNFEHMPELSWHYGYPFALLIMAAIGASILAWFRVRRWL
jgi:magnesium transporter